MPSIFDIFTEIAERHEEPERIECAPAPKCKRCRWTGRELNERGLCQDCQNTLDRGYEISMKSGRCRTGSDFSNNYQFHARLLNDEGYPEYEAICGTQPGRHSPGWSDWNPEDRKVTCSRCLKRLAAIP